MKNQLKMFIIWILTIIFVIASLPVMSFAESPGGTLNNPINLGTGGKYKKIWSNQNDHLDFYVKFKMTKRGVVTIYASKPYDDEGEISSYELSLYNSKGALIWDCDTEGQQNVPTKNYSYKVGLNKGTYILRFDPSFYMISGISSSTVSIKTSANANWEIESNDSFEKATLLKLNKKMTAVYKENMGFTSDYFKIKLTKGKKYTIRIGKYDELFSSTTLCHIYDPSRVEVKEYNHYGRAGSTLEERGTVVIKPNKSGYYYIKIYNGSDEAGAQYNILVR